MTTDLRERILDNALDLMAERGAAGTSMRQLAKACDVHVAALYHYFESKDALLTAVIAERNYTGRMAEPLAIDRSAPARDRLAALFGQMWNGALDEEAVWRLLLGEGIRSEPAALPVGRSLIDALRPGVTSWIAEWLPEVAHPAEAADVILGQMFFGFLRYMFEPGLDTHRFEAEAVAVLATVLLEDLSVPQGPRPAPASG